MSVRLRGLRPKSFRMPSFRPKSLGLVGPVSATTMGPSPRRALPVCEERRCPKNDDDNGNGGIGDYESPSPILEEEQWAENDFDVSAPPSPSSEPESQPGREHNQSNSANIEKWEKIQPVSKTNQAPTRQTGRSGEDGCYVILEVQNRISV